MKPDHLIGKLKDAKYHLELFRQYSKELNISLQELALSYLLNIKEIDAIIIGCTTKKELTENYKIFTSFKSFNFNYKLFNIQNENIVNPMNWDV
jgi:predicted aldo/keto reductase-like oxidoreductase